MSLLEDKEEGVAGDPDGDVDVDVTDGGSDANKKKHRRNFTSLKGRLKSHTTLTFTAGKNSP
jgi:hypothetical protein